MLRTPLGEIVNLFDPCSSQIVIELDGDNEKAWYRRGQACIRLKDFDRAKTSFMKVASISGGQFKYQSKDSYNDVLLCA